MKDHHEMGFENTLNNNSLTNEKSKSDPPPLSPPPTHTNEMFRWKWFVIQNEISVWKLLIIVLSVVVLLRVYTIL